MRVGRVLVLLLAVALAGLLSGGAASPAPAAAAAVDAASALFPVYAGTAQAAPAPAAPAAAVRAVPVAAPFVAVPRDVPRNRRVGPLPDPPPVPVPGTPCLSSARACVDLAAQQAWLIDGRAVAYGPVPITHGRRGFRTSTGTFDVDFRNRDHISSIYDAPMPFSVFFDGGIAFHQGSLREQSHGCIHLSRDAAREFFDVLRRGDLVQVV